MLILKISYTFATELITYSFLIIFLFYYLMLSIQDNLILDSNNGVILPVVRYKTYAHISQEVAFKGAVTPVPNSLITYLKGSELKIFMLILSELRSHAICYLSQSQIGEMIGITNISVSHIMKGLVDMGLIIYGYDKNAKRNNRKKSINFEAIAKLDEILKDAKPECVVKFREKVGFRNVTDFTPEQLEWFNLFCKKPANDIEAEEYK